MATMSKKFKANEARKNAEALKAKKKEIRTGKNTISNANVKTGTKGKSLIAQSKKKK